MREQKYFKRGINFILLTEKKKSLNPYNDKKYISFEGGEFTCFSYGHYKIDNHRVKNEMI